MSSLTEPGAPSVAIVAPAGYGKSILLKQLSDAVAAETAWITLGPEHDDLAVLLREICEAVARASDPRSAATTGQPADVDAALFAWAMAGPQPPTLVLDHIDVVRDPGSADALARLVSGAPGGARALLAARTAPSIPLPKLQAEGRLVVLGAGDLDFDRREARALLRASGLHLGEADVTTLWERTEGWPAVLRLAETWLRSGPHREVSDLRGTIPLIAEYLRSEVLSGCSPRDQRFLGKAVVLDRASAALCDAALETTGSRKMLERLVSRGLLHPEDADGGWFRAHPLVRDLVGAHLDNDDPDARADILGRAAAWCEEHGEPEAAVRYAMASDDVDRVLRIATTRAQPMFQVGNGEPVAEWFEWLRVRVPPSRLGPAAVLATFSAVLLGRGEDAERWIEIAHRAAKKTPGLDVPDAAESMEPWLALGRALICRSGAEAMAADAQMAIDGLSPMSSWYPTARMYRAIALTLAGSPDDADDELADAAEQLEHDGAANALLVVLSERALIAVHRGDTKRARALLDRACEVRDASGLTEYISSALSYALSARIALSRADLPLARRQLAKTQRFRPMLSHVVPWLAVQVLLEMVHVQIALADAPGARTLLREIDGIVHRRPELGTLVEEAADARRQVDGIRVAAPGASALTSAEIRLLPMLRTHLPFPEIAVSLFLSKHTVKTQAISIYRKLGVTSRSDAVSRATELGLLEP